MFDGIGIIEIKGKNVFITGASRGIGKTIAIKLSEAGLNVALFARSENDLEKTIEVCRSYGNETLSLPGDITDEKSVLSTVHKAIEHFGNIDILVNNAGIGILKPLIDLEVDEFDQMVSVNLRGTYLCTRAFLPSMIEQKHGDIINISSIAGKVGFAKGTGYAATKFGVMGFAESLMHEVREYGLRIITICPGSTNTSFGNQEKDRPGIIQAEDIAELVIMGIKTPIRATLSQIEIRVANPPKSMN